MIRQLSIYAKNEKGTMRRLLSALAAENINVLGFVNNDSGEFGTVRMIVDDFDKGYDILTNAGYLCSKSSVMGIELPDRPGELEAFLNILDDMNVNIDYMYVGYSRENSQPIILLHTSNMSMISDTIARKGYTVY